MFPHRLGVNAIGVGTIFSYSSASLVGEGETTHAGLDAEHVVVGGEHVHGGAVVGASLEGHGHLGVVDAREVARAGWLVLLWLQREGIGIHTWVWVAGVVVVGLHLVEVLAVLLLEAVLAVKHKLEGVQWANRAAGSHGAILEPRLGGGVGAVAHRELGAASKRGALEGHAVGIGEQSQAGIWGGINHHITGHSIGAEVPHLGVGATGVEAPHQLLDWVVVGQTHLLGGTSSHGVGTGVLHLLDEVLMTLLGEAAALLGVKVDVVTPHLGGVGAEVLAVVGSQVDVQTHLVVLEGDEWQVEAWVAVEEEDEWQVHLACGAGHWVGGHLAPLGLLGLIEAQLGVQAPPLLVVLVDTLATDGQLDVSHGTLGHPARIEGGVGVSLQSGGGGELQVHITDEVTVAGHSHGEAAAVTGRAVHGLLDVLHGKVGVTLVHRLEEGNLGVTGKEYVLSAISHKLHEAAGHDFVILYPKKIFLGRSHALTHLPPPPSPRPPS
jgi:hypothetical protein